MEGRKDGRKEYRKVDMKEMRTHERIAGMKEGDFACCSRLVGLEDPH